VETDSALKIRPCHPVWNLIGRPGRQLVSIVLIATLYLLISTFKLINYRKFKIFSKYSCSLFLCGCETWDIVLRKHHGQLRVLEKNIGADRVM
jgi:hypothetical protein